MTTAGNILGAPPRQQPAPARVPVRRDARPAATGRSLRTSSPRAPTMQQTLSLYSPDRLVAISV